jgi:hypothetical protein
MWSSRDVLKVSQWSGDGPGSAASHTVMPRIAVVELHHDRAPLRRLNTASCFTSSPRALGRGARMIPGRVRRLRRAGDHGRRHPSATAARGHRRSPGRPRPGTMLDVARGRGTGRPRAEPRASAATGAARTGPAARVGRHRRRHRRGAVVAAAQGPETNWTASRRASAGERARDPSAGVVLNSTRPGVWTGGAECRRPIAEQAHCCARRGPTRLGARPRRLGGRWPCSTVQPRTAPTTVLECPARGCGRGEHCSIAAHGAVDAVAEVEVDPHTPERVLPRWGSTSAVAKFR